MLYRTVSDRTISDWTGISDRTISDWTGISDWTISDWEYRYKYIVVYINSI